MSESTGSANSANAPAAGEDQTPAEAQAGGEFARLLAEQEAGKKQEVKVGAKVQGVLVKIGAEDSFVDFGGRSEGRLKTLELLDAEGKPGLVVGDPIEAYVVEDQAEILLTRFVHQHDQASDKLYQAFKAGIPVEGQVKATNKWGLGVDIQGVRAFCPMSQIDTRFVEDPQSFKDQVMQFKILRYSDQGRNIVLSRRALLEKVQDEQAAQVKGQIAEGALLSGKVTRMEGFGAFVELGGGIEGMIHVSELSHERVGHPNEVLKEGQEVQVRVLKVKDLDDRRKARISLSLKAMQQDPWASALGSLKEGTVVSGKVEALETFGAFVELEGKVRGLVHVSELADKRVAHPRDVLSLGQEVKVLVLEVDARRKRLRLSIKQAESAEANADLKEFRQRQQQEETQSQGGNALVEALRRAQLVQ
ncbi:MAG: S1 RNA-binding domain-containing protein [Candidatus Latescibacteria bacterium]|nr:S1 RNA-binding domain-containing protein [Candidatus Latescibacterota bacterium]